MYGHCTFQYQGVVVLQPLVFTPHHLHQDQE